MCGSSTPFIIQNSKFVISTPTLPLEGQTQGGFRYGFPGPTLFLIDLDTHSHRQRKPVAERFATVNGSDIGMSSGVRLFPFYCFS